MKRGMTSSELVKPKRLLIKTLACSRRIMWLYDFYDRSVLLSGVERKCRAGQVHGARFQQLAERGATTRSC